MARPKQVIINDLMGELDKFGGHITQIRDAIQSKGVTSEGKLFKFADEINSIEPASTYAYVLDAVKRANNKGYSDNEVIGMLDNLTDKNTPQPPVPQPNPSFDPATATEIPARQFYGRSDLEGELNCPNVIKVGANAFTGCEYSIVKLPQATDINKDAFKESYITLLDIPKFVWKDSNLDLTGAYDLFRITTIVVADDSVPPDNLAFTKPGIIVYNHDSSKKWDVYNNVWKPV
jgi:hypothetical protein